MVVKNQSWPEFATLLYSKTAATFAGSDRKTIT